MVNTEDESDSENEFDFDAEEEKNNSNVSDEEYEGNDHAGGNDDERSQNLDDGELSDREDSSNNERSHTGKDKNKNQKSKSNSKIDSNMSDFIVSSSDDDSYDDSDDYEDDVPLSSLKFSTSSTKSKTDKKTSKKQIAQKKKKSPVKKKKVTSSKKTKQKKVSDSPISKSNTSETLKLASAELYSKCDKGKLIQALLCRWWYAFTWPDPKSIPADPPKYYDALDGYPGVFVCTNGDDVGDVKDFRDKSTCPNFKNFANKTSDELKELLFIAIEKQKEILIDAEGQGTETEKELIKLLKWSKKLNAKKADKDAMKVLKAARLSIN